MITRLLRLFYFSCWSLDNLPVSQSLKPQTQPQSQSKLRSNKIYIITSAEPSPRGEVRNVESCWDRGFDNIGSLETVVDECVSINWERAESLDSILERGEQANALNEVVEDSLNEVITVLEADEEEQPDSVPTIFENSPVFSEAPIASSLLSTPTTIASRSFSSEVLEFSPTLRRPSLPPHSRRNWHLNRNVVLHEKRKNDFHRLKNNNLTHKRIITMVKEYLADELKEFCKRLAQRDRDNQAFFQVLARILYDENLNQFWDKISFPIGFEGMQTIIFDLEKGQKDQEKLLQICFDHVLFTRSLRSERLRGLQERAKNFVINHNESPKVDRLALAISGLPLENHLEL